MHLLYEPLSVELSFQLIPWYTIIIIATSTITLCSHLVRASYVPGAAPKVLPALSHLTPPCMFSGSYCFSIFQMRKQML